MKASYLLGAALSALFATAPAMADSDFRAVEQLSNASAMSEAKLSAVEGGAYVSNSGVLGDLIAVNASTNVIKQSLTQSVSVKQSNSNTGNATAAATGTGGAASGVGGTGGAGTGTATASISQSNTSSVSLTGTQTANAGTLSVSFH